MRGGYRGSAARYAQAGLRRPKGATKGGACARAVENRCGMRTIFCRWPKAEANAISPTCHPRACSAMQRQRRLYAQGCAAFGK